MGLQIMRFAAAAVPHQQEAWDVVAAVFCVSSAASQLWPGTRATLFGSQVGAVSRVSKERPNAVLFGKQLCLSSVASLPYSFIVPIARRDRQ